MLKTYSELRNRKKNQEQDNAKKNKNQDKIIKNTTQVYYDRSLPLQQTYHSITDFPIYKKPQKNTKVFKAYEIDTEENGNDKNNKLATKYFILSIAEKIRQSYTSQFLSQLGFSPFSLALLSFSFLSTANAEVAPIIFKYGKLNGFENLCSSNEQMVYCEQLHILQENTVLAQFATQLIPDENWNEKIDHRNFLFDFKEKFEHSQLKHFKEFLNNEFFNKQNFKNCTTTLENKYDHETFISGNEWTWKLLRISRGLTNESYAKIKKAFPATEYASNNWNYNIHGLVATLISISTALVSVGLVHLIKKKFCNRNAIDPRKIILIEEMNSPKRKPLNINKRKPIIVTKPKIASPTDTRPYIAFSSPKPQKISPSSERVTERGTSLLKIVREQLNKENKISNNENIIDNKNLILNENKPKNDNDKMILNTEKTQEKLENNDFSCLQIPKINTDLIGNNEPQSKDIIFSIGPNKDKINQIADVMATLREATMELYDLSDSELRENKTTRNCSIKI